MDCTPAGLGGKVDVLKVVVADVTGDGVPDAIVRAECAHSASEWPDSVYVYSDASGTPVLIGTLLSQKDGMYAPSATPSGHAVTLGLVGWSTFAAGCCPDLHYTQTFTWNGSKFVPGARHDQVMPCGDTAFTVTTADQQAATGHETFNLEFKNRLPQACTVFGYPGLDAVTASGHLLAHAKRTMTGFTGGAHTMQTLTVAPGQTVSARVEWMSFDPVTTQQCTMSDKIEVTPANTKSTVELPAQVSICELQVHPTVAGSTGLN
jgi:Protein of unknown function (DUF4232)